MTINMDYCKFENTLEALTECLDAFDSNGLSEEESKARLQLLEVCKSIASQYTKEYLNDLDGNGHLNEYED